MAAEAWGASDLHARCVKASGRFKDEVHTIVYGIGGKADPKWIPGLKDFTLVTLLKSASAKERAGLLKTMRKETAWGTPERAAVCYASAWYGSTTSHAETTSCMRSSGSSNTGSETRHDLFPIYGPKIQWICSIAFTSATTTFAFCTT